MLAEIGFAGVSLAYRSQRNGGDLVLIDGHMRLEECGPGFAIPCAVLDLSDAEADKLLLLMAPLGEMAGADVSQLDQLLAGMQIDRAELRDMMKAVAKRIDAEFGKNEVTQDVAPAPPEDPVTQLGDCWVLGQHRLLCGNSSKPEELDRLLGGSPIHLVNTDPPYNVNVEPRSKNAIAAGNSSFTNEMYVDPGRESATRAPGQMRAKDRKIANDQMSAAEFDAMLDAWFGNVARVLVPGGSFYFWGGYANLNNYPAALARCGLLFGQHIFWDKMHPVLSRKDFMGSFEICFTGSAPGAPRRWFAPGDATNLWRVKKVNPQAMVHLTEKPVDLAARAIGYSSLPGENVLDLFSGSGSTMMACEQTGRRAFVMELDPPYCDVAVRRWEAFTGRQALRIAPGAVIPEPGL